jgi:hypothetical protein
LAVRDDSNNASAHYILGQGIRALVEQDLLSNAEEALRKYLELGAPRGDVDDVQKFLDDRSRALSPSLPSR